MVNAAALFTQNTITGARKAGNAAPPELPKLPPQDTVILSPYGAARTPITGSSSAPQLPRSPGTASENQPPRREGVGAKLARAGALATLGVAMMSPNAAAVAGTLAGMLPMPTTIAAVTTYGLQNVTAARLARLEQAMRKEGYRIHVTCTTGGRHAGGAHAAGRAIDFAVLKNGTYIDDLGWRSTAAHSERVSELARQQGFYVYNEYLNHSQYKTGPHIHVEL